MSAKYPDLQKICRLCLVENEGTICIFPKEKSSADKYSALSIPMRIMACTSLEIQDCDDFPKKICTECRLQLEKSYYFRKRSQASDSKLKRHLRTISMGKISTVFAKHLDDDDDNEFEFKDSFEFIQEQEDKKKQEEIKQFEEKINEIKREHERELKDFEKAFRTKYQEELEPLMEEIKTDLRVEIQKEIEENLRHAIMDQCLVEAKNIVRSEVREECRQLEIKSLLDDLQTYLTNKKQILEVSPTKVIKSNKKQPQALEIGSRVEYLEVEFHSQSEEGENVSNQMVTEQELNPNDEECNSDGNYVACETDDGLEVQKKMTDNIVEHQANNDANDMSYEDDEMDNKNDLEIMNNNEESQETTSYRIDSESGEIQFLKNGEDFNNELGDDNMDQSCYENIMIIKLPDKADCNLIEELEETQKCSKPKKQLLKSEKSPEKKTRSIVSTSVSKTKTTVEATILTKTYVNPMQRSTDTPKIFKCNDCPMVFSTKHSLDRHLRTHEKVERLGVNFQCPECRIVVSCSSALRRHMYTHYEKKPFPCNLCNKSFVQREILKRHMQTHTGIKPHQCTQCDRTFAQRINLTQHINRHHLQEPRLLQHSCHFCPKRFNHASGLSRHLASHSGVAFQCSECDRTFGDRSSIKRHIASMHTNAKIPKSENKLK